MSNQVTAVDASNKKDATQSSTLAQTVLGTVEHTDDILWNGVEFIAKDDPLLEATLLTSGALHGETFATLEGLTPGGDPLYEKYSESAASFATSLWASPVLKSAIQGLGVSEGLGAASFAFGAAGLAYAGGKLIKWEYDYLNAHEGDIINFFVNHGDTLTQAVDKLHDAVDGVNQSVLNLEQSTFVTAVAHLAQQLGGAHNNPTLASQALISFETALTGGLSSSIAGAFDTLGQGAVDNSSIKSQMAAELSIDGQSLTNLYGGGLSALLANSAALNDPTLATQTLNDYLSGHTGTVSGDVASTAGREIALTGGHSVTLADGVLFDPQSDGSLSLSAFLNSDRPTTTFIQDDGEAVITKAGVGGDPWNQITDSYDQFIRLTDELQANKDGGSLDTAYDPSHGGLVSSIRSVAPDQTSTFAHFDLADASWKSFTDSFDSHGDLTQSFQLDDDGSSTDITFDPLQNEAISTIYAVNADGSAAFTQYDLADLSYTQFTGTYDPSGDLLRDFQINDDGSTLDQTYAPSDNDALRSVLATNPDHTSTFTQYGLDSDNYKQFTQSFDASGALTQLYQVNTDSTSVDAVYNPDLDGALSSTYVTEADGSSILTQNDLLSDFWKQITDTYNAAGNVLSSVQINNDGSGTVLTFDAGTGKMTQKTTVDADGSITRVFWSAAGVLLHTLHLGPAGQILQDVFASTVTSDQMFGINIDTLAGLAITQFLKTNNLPLSIAIQAFAKSDPLSALIGGNSAEAFLTQYSNQVAKMAEGILGTDAGQALFKAIGLDSQPELIIGGIVGKTAVIDLSNFVSANFTAILDGSASLSSLDAAFDGFDVAVATAAVNALAHYVENLLGAKLGGDAPIGGEIGGAIGGFVGGPIGEFVGTIIGSLIGSLFGGHPSVGPNAVAFDEYNTTTKLFGLTQSGADNGGDVQIARDMVNAEAGDENMILAAIGGHVVGTVQPNSLGYFKGKFFYAPGKVNPDPFPNQFNDATSAVDFSVLTTLHALHIQGGNPFMEYALAKSVATSASGLIDDLNAAHDYGQYLANPLAFDAGLAISANATQQQTWIGELARANALGLDQFVITGSNTVSAVAAAARIIANVAALQTLAAGGQLTSTVVKDTAANVLASKTALQGLFTAHELTSITVADTVINVIANLAALQALITAAQLKSLVLSDTAAHVQTNIAALETLVAGGTLSSLMLTDTTVPVFSFSTAGWLGASPLLGKITNSYQLSITDSAVNILANLDSFESQAGLGRMSAITLTDHGTPTLSMTATKFASDIGALSKISSPYNVIVSTVPAANASSVAGQSHVAAIVVSDSSVAVGLNLDALQTLASTNKIGSIGLTDGATQALIVQEKSFLQDTAALQKISGPYNLTVFDVLAADATATAANPHVISLKVDDTAQNILAQRTPLLSLRASGKITAIDISDTAAGIAGHIGDLESLAAAGRINSIVVTDPASVLNVTAVQLAADRDVLNLIASHYLLESSSPIVALPDKASVDFIGSNQTIIPGHDDFLGVHGTNNWIMVDGDDGILLKSAHGIVDPSNAFGSNAMVGGSGDDVLSAGPGVDELLGGAGNDTFIAPGSATGGTITVWGGTQFGLAGSDTVDYSGIAGDLRIELGQGLNGHSTFGWVADGNAQYLAELFDIDNAIGGLGDDTITGNSDANRIDGGSGNNWLSGGAGNDTFIAPGIGGTDVVWGGTVTRADGFDTVDYSLSAEDLVINLAAGVGPGGYEGLVTAGGRTLAQLNGISAVIAGVGNDTLISGPGGETLTGGAGSDHFVFDRGDGLDTITDFTPAGAGADLIDLRGDGFANFAALQPLLSQVGNSIVITFDAHDQITLQNVHLAQLTASDFLFA